jgi:hypothetical protein
MPITDEERHDQSRKQQAITKAIGIVIAYGADESLVRTLDEIKVDMLRDWRRKVSAEKLKEIA